MSKDTAAGAWTWKEFFKGECGYSRFLTGVLILYLISRDGQVLTLVKNIFGL